MKKNSEKENLKMPNIIYQDKNVLAINKPAGLLVHPAREVNSKFEARNSKQIQNPKTQKLKTLTDWLDKKFPGAQLAHRLDKDTSGVLTIAKNEKAYEFIKEQFKNRKIRKIYIALVKGEMKNTRGKIETPIKRFTKSREAETEYKVIKKFPDYTLLEVYPKTGRTHQIRIHLKSIGHPIVCEKLYVKRPNCPFGLKRHFLHAKSIELTLPGGARIKLEADLPEDLKTVLESLKSKNLNPKNPKI